MRRTEKASDYNTITAENLAEYIRGDAYMLIQAVEAGEIEKLNRAKAKRIAAALNNIMKEIEG